MLACVRMCVCIKVTAYAGKYVLLSGVYPLITQLWLEWHNVLLCLPPAGGVFLVCIGVFNLTLLLVK